MVSLTNLVLQIFKEITLELVYIYLTKDFFLISGHIYTHNINTLEFTIVALIFTSNNLMLESPTIKSV